MDSKYLFKIAFVNKPGARIANARRCLVETMRTPIRYMETYKQLAQRMGILVIDGETQRSHFIRESCPLNRGLANTSWKLSRTS